MFSIFRNLFWFIFQTTAVYFYAGSDLRKVGKIQLRTYHNNTARQVKGLYHGTFITFHLKQRVNIVSARRNSIGLSRPSQCSPLFGKIVQTRTLRNSANLCKRQNITNDTKIRRTFKRERENLFILWNQVYPFSKYAKRNRNIIFELY